MRTYNRYIFSIRLMMPSSYTALELTYRLPHKLFLRLAGIEKEILLWLLSRRRARIRSNTICPSGEGS